MFNVFKNWLLEHKYSSYFDLVRQRISSGVKVMPNRKKYHMVTVFPQITDKINEKGVKSGINMCSDEITCCKYANQNENVSV